MDAAQPAGSRAATRTWGSSRSSSPRASAACLSRRSSERGYFDCGEAEYEARFERRRLAGIATAAKSLGFEFVARDPLPA